jgi:hypothetical protein
MSKLTKPVFVVGSPRSGTSVLTWCLGQHPNILLLEETSWIGKFAVELNSTYDLGALRGERSQLSAMGITNAEFYEHFGDAINNLILRHKNRLKQLCLESAIRNPEQVNDAFKISRSLDNPKKRWVDGTPEYSFYIFGLLKLFPHAKFIHILRDVKSVVKSMMHFSAVGKWNLIETEQEAYDYWLRAVQACIEAERAFGSEKILRVRYMDLTSSSEKVIRRCLDFLNESFCAHCLEPLQTRINSSKVPSDYNPYDANTDPRIREEAEHLSQELLKEIYPEYAPEQKSISKLENDFMEQAKFISSLDIDRLKTLDRSLANFAKNSSRGKFEHTALGD